MTVADGAARTLTTVETVPPVGSPARAALGAGIGAAAYAALVVTAALPRPLGYLVVALVVAATEVALPRLVPVLPWAAERLGVGRLARALLRGVALLLLAARSGSAAGEVAVAAALLALAAVLAARAGLDQLVGYLRSPPVLSRNVALDAVRIPPAPPRAVRDGRDVGWLDLPAQLGVAVGIITAATGVRGGPLAAGLAGTLLLALGPGLLLAAHAVRAWRAGLRTAVPSAIADRLAALRPEVVLYFAGAPASRYQVEMWLEPVERLGRPAVVLLRDRDVLADLAPTSLPVLCVPHGGTLMAMDLPTVRLALYVANAAGNIHLLRRRGVGSVFVGHGDSDKAASASPFTRVYDEVWVAGPAGRARYQLADVGIAPDRIVEVGRPQLAGAAVPAPRATPPRPAPLTVLYAPTWEGWGDEPHHSSLADAGPALVAALLARPGVRVLYRPHPLTGSRDDRVRRGDAEVRRLLRAAGAAGPEVAPPRPAASPGAGDLLDRARRSGAGGWSRSTYAQLVTRWAAAYWAAAPERHRILTAPAPDLFGCFAVADALVADVSSVTTDFLVVDRPYAVVVPGGVLDPGFVERYPSAGAAVLLETGLGRLDELLAAAAGAADRLAGARRSLRRALLGVEDVDLGTEALAAGFRAAVTRWCVVPAEPGCRLGGGVGYRSEPAGFAADVPDAAAERPT